MGKPVGIQLNDSESPDEFMDLKIHPIRDTEGKILSGLVIGDTLEQNKALILLASEGEYIFNPTLGVGIEEALLSTEYLYYRHKIRDQFFNDGLQVSRLDFYHNKPFRVDANY
jgi:hypothetical protein